MIENHTQLDSDKQHQVETFGSVSEPAVTFPKYHNQLTLAGDICQCEWCCRFRDMDETVHV